MNLTLLKNYAPAARKAFIEAVTRRAGMLGVHPDRVDPVTESGDVALIGGQPFPRSIVPLRKQLWETIQREGYAATMEAMAYTWFNRLVAIRFMELHDGWLSHGYRVLSHPDGHSLPEIIQHAEHLDVQSLDKDEVIRLKLAGNRDEELYRLLLLAQCAELNRILPDVFSRLDDATILLLPDNLLHSDSLVRQLVANSSEEDWKEVEVLGWLYQFYISEKKDTVMARKSAVPTEDIPAVTQLFTPHWIVRYLVENSLGRLWLLNRPGSRLREHMPYFIGDADEEKDELGSMNDENRRDAAAISSSDTSSFIIHPSSFLRVNKPEEIRLVDPAVGSGHMLTYAFDLLTLIYEEEGYAPTEIPALILRHNLHGLEICPRAAQLAELALVFKAREKSRRFFQPEHLVRPRIIELRDVRFAEGELSDYFKALGVNPSAISPNLIKLLHQFEEAKNFGSLIQPCMSESQIQSAFSSLHNSSFIIHNSEGLFLRETHLKVLRVLEQAEALTQRYHCTVMNPPYLSGAGMNPKLKEFALTTYKEFKADTYAMFTRRCSDLVFKNGYCSLVTVQGWLYSGSFTSMRKFLIEECSLKHAVQIGYNSFPELNSKYAVAVMFTFAHASGGDGKAAFIDLNSAPTNADKHELFFERLNSRHCYKKSPKEFIKLPGYPFAYSVSSKLLKLFTALDPFSSVGTARSGLQTGDNERFLRFWHEVAQSRTTAKFVPEDGLPAKWIFHPKGGFFRRWYGNLEYCVDWQNGGKEIINHPSARPQNREWYFQAGVTWSHTGLYFGARRLSEGLIFNVEAPTFFSDIADDFILGALNCCVTTHLFQSIYQSLHFLAGDVMVLPFLLLDETSSSSVKQIVDQCISLAKADWDNFETSWDFRDQPLLRPELKGATLEASWRNWEAQCTTAIRRMQELETENNRLFIAAYGLDGELQPEVPEEQITLARADAKKDMAAFLSYAVGCMMGRYSLEQPGLILADAGDSLENYLSKVGKSMGQLTFVPDADGIIPVLDAEWFDDDIVARTKEFLRVTFGEATLGENMRFIEASLSKDLRSYFLADFYKDHLQTYKNRPIYWLFSSGKQRAFQCLVYLHRYQEATLPRIRTEYVIPLQGKVAAAISRLEEEIPNTTSSSTRKKLQTELDKTKKQMAELLAYDEQLRSYADQRIALDLDDGVKVNYAKFGPLVAEAKKICGTKDD